jgi:hypothetical protein
MIVSTAQIQKAADRFYRKSGFQQIRTEVAETMTAKQAGGGLTRFHGIVNLVSRIDVSLSYDSGY